MFREQLSWPFILLHGRFSIILGVEKLNHVSPVIIDISAQIFPHDSAQWCQLIILKADVVLEQYQECINWAMID